MCAHSRHHPAAPLGEASAQPGAVGAAARRDRTLIRLLLGTGIRIGSALALDVADVDLAGGLVRGLRRQFAFHRVGDLLGLGLRHFERGLSR